jgi:hypothetical protein
MDMGTGKRVQTRTRVVIGLGIAVLALLVLTTTAFAAGPFAHFQAGNGNKGTNGNTGNKAAMMNQGFGPEAIVSAVDTTAQTITLAGVPQQMATIKVDANVKLTAIQPDGTSKDAAIGDFKAGSLVRVQFNIQRPNRGNGNNGNNGTPPANNGNGQMPAVTVKGLALLPVGTVHVQGLVTANNNGTIQIIDAGGLQLTVNASGAKITKGQNAAAATTDITVGTRIMATGTQSGTTVNATTVRIIDLSALGQRGARPGKGTGTATATT